MVFEDALVTFSTVFERLKRGTPGAQNKLNLINHIILDELSKVEGVAKVITRGRSIEIVPADGADITQILSREKIDEIVSNALNEVIT